MKTFLKTVGLISLFLLCLWLTRSLWLRAMGDYLDAGQSWPDPPAQLGLVLAGGARDRAPVAAEGWQQGRVARWVVTGSAVPEPLAAYGLTATEAELSARVLIRSGVPDSQIHRVARGTSTHEECAWWVDSCRRAGLRRAVIVSHQHHTRRIRWQVDRLLLPSDSLQVWVIGAPHADYSARQWWRSEAGLLFVSSEYLKLAYYVVTY